MKKNLLKVISICLCMILSFSVIVQNANANAIVINNPNKIISIASTEEIDNYANNIVKLHISALHRDKKYTRIQNNNISEYKLAKSFTSLNVKTNEITYFYPVIFNNNITFILQVNKDIKTNELCSSLSEAFSKQLENLLNNNSNKKYYLLTDSNTLVAYDGKTYTELYQVYKNNSKFDFSIFKLLDFVKYDTDSLTINDLSNSKNIFSSDIKYYVVDGPNSYKTVDIDGVSQGNHPWCWAATCAAMINYYKNKDLTASEVANYVFPDDPEQGGTWTNMKKAYNHWNLYPYQTNKISFSSIQNKINNDKPMHLGLVGHSVGLIGYEDWDNTYVDEEILILLEPNGGVHKSVTLKSNGNFNYYLTGNDTWKYTRIF